MVFGEESFTSSRVNHILLRLLSLSDLDSYRTTPAAETATVRHKSLDTATPVIPIYEYTIYTQFLSIRDWFLKFSECSCDWQMGKKEIRAPSPHYDDGDSQEESETSEMSGTSSEKRRLDSTREEFREAGQEAFRMAARKFGPEERDLDDDYMAQIQELQEQLSRLRRQSSATDGNGTAAGRFASADIMAFDLKAQLTSHDGCDVTGFENRDQRPV
jgi:hypothetical protein